MKNAWTGKTSLHIVVEDVWNSMRVHHISVQHLTNVFQMKILAKTTVLMIVFSAQKPSHVIFTHRVVIRSANPHSKAEHSTLTTVSILKAASMELNLARHLGPVTGINN